MKQSKGLNGGLTPEQKKKKKKKKKKKTQTELDSTTDMDSHVWPRPDFVLLIFYNDWCQCRKTAIKRLLVLQFNLVMFGPL